MIAVDLMQQDKLIRSCEQEILRKWGREIPLGLSTWAHDYDPRLHLDVLGLGVGDLCLGGPNRELFNSCWLHWAERSLPMAKMIGAHASKVRPGGFKNKAPVRDNLTDVREAVRVFFNKRIKVKSEWNGSFQR